MAWGRAHEKEALTDYTLKHSTSHLDVVISEAGLCLHPEHPHLAASPDGFISCSCCGNGVIEIKCPFKFRGQSVASMFMCLRNRKLFQNLYTALVVSQMMLTKWLDVTALLVLMNGITGAVLDLRQTPGDNIGTVHLAKQINSKKQESK